MLGWAQAKTAEPLDGPIPDDITPLGALDPVVAQAVDGLGIRRGPEQTLRAPPCLS